MKTTFSTCVMIPVYGESQELIDCIKSVLRFTPRNVEIFVCDDSSPNKPTSTFLAESGVNTSRIKFQRRVSNLGYVENCNSFLKDIDEQNVIILNSDVEVSTGWFDALTKPLQIYENVGTVTAMTDNGTIATVQIGPEKLPIMNSDLLFQINKELSGDQDLKLAELLTGVGHCILISWQAIQIVGVFDNAFSPGYGEEVDFCIRATKFGFKHYLANTLVKHAGSKTFGTSAKVLKDRNEVKLESKHPGYHSIISNHALFDKQIEVMFLNVLTKVRKVRLLIDGRLLSPQLTGTSRLTFNLITNASLNAQWQIYVLVNKIHKSYWDKLLPEFCKVVTFDEIRESGNYFDVALSPYQVSSSELFLELAFWAKRVIIAQLDFISYDNWKYFSNTELYFNYRSAINKTYDSADAIVYISNFVKNQAKDKFVRENCNDRVMFCGVNHLTSNSIKPYIPNRVLLVGAAFAHKNLDYALTIFEKLNKKVYGLVFVFVGPKPSDGFDENFFKRIQGNEHKNVEYFSWISEEKLQEEILKAHLILYPSMSEGFGFIPFESAHSQRACLFSANTSLAELLGDAPALLSYSIERDVQIVLSLLTQKDFYNRQLEYLQEKAKQYTWDKSVSVLELTVRDVMRSKRISRDQSTGEINVRFLIYSLARRISYKMPFYKIFPLYSRRRSVIIILMTRLLKVGAKKVTKF